MEREPSEELERILDDLAYQMTAARTAGVQRPEELRAALRRARDLVAEADALAAMVAAKRKEGRREGEGQY
jgi:hypothetical protein